MLGSILQTLTRLYYGPSLLRSYFALNSALTEERWGEVVRIGTEMRSKDFDSDRLRFLVGTAHVHMGSFEQAAREFSAITSRSRDIKEEASLQIHYAIALHSLARDQEAASILRAQELDRWPAPDRERANKMLQEIGSLASPIQ